MDSKFRKIGWVLLTGVIGCTSTVPDSSAEETDEAMLIEKARAIHERVLTLDTHDDIPFDFATPEVDPGVEGDRQVDLPKMRAGLLDVAFFIVYVGQTERTPENYLKAQADAMIKFNAIHRLTNELYPDQIELAYTPADVERIHAAGKLVAAIGIENGYVIGRDLKLLSKYHELGARYVTLAHSGHNDIADSSSPRPALGDAETEHGGLSDFGRQVVEEMNRLGIMVDISHISKQAMLDATRHSRAPVIASHSSAKALCGHSRNLDDEQLLALKANGGVMNTVALGAFVKEDPPEKRAALDQLMEEFGVSRPYEVRSLADAQQAAFRQRRAELDERWPPANVADFVDHIDYAVKLIGLDHVGISSDFDGGGGVEGWNHAGETPNVTIELVRRGYTEEQIAQLWSGNLLRVWRQVEEIAQQSEE